MTEPQVSELVIYRGRIRAETVLLEVLISEMTGPDSSLSQDERHKLLKRVRALRSVVDGKKPHESKRR